MKLAKPLTVFLAACLIVAASKGAPAENVRLRGYGRVEAHIGPQISEFSCENDAKADILLGKLLADMFWDAPGGATQKTVKIGAREAVLRSWQPFGAVLAGRCGNEVLIIGGANEAQTLDVAKKDGRFAARPFQFTPTKPYPIYLDYYDLRAFKSNNSALPLDQLNSAWTSTRQLGFGGVASGGEFRETPADGVVDWSTQDYDVASTERENLLMLMKVSTGEWPRWAWNGHPDYIGQESDHSVFELDVTDTQLGEGLGLTLAERKQTSLDYLARTMLRYRNSPSLGGWELYCGDYIFETYYLSLYQGILDYSQTGEEAFRQWLRLKRGLSLKELGERWHGDPAHFTDWKQVQLPDDINSFFGDLNESSFRIHDGWSWNKAQTTDVTAPPADAATWVPIEMPPAKYMFLFPRPGFYKASFDPSAWLTKNAGKDIYLVCNMNAPGWYDYMVWLNGDSLGTFKSKIKPYDGPIGMKLTGLLRGGNNTLVIKSPDRIRGPVFLTTTKPVGYPYFGKYRNAQYLDLVEWQLDALDSKVAQTMEFARGIDPDRPLELCSSSSEVKDGQGMALSRFGGSMHDTGYEASYRPFDSRLGYAEGFYGDAEPSAIPFREEDLAKKNTSTIDRMRSWMLINAEGSMNTLGNPATYIELEQKTGWMSKNKRLLQLFGKYLPEKPKIAILFSSQNSLLGGNDAAWDIGRGELHGAHYDNVYVTEGMLAKGAANEYPVLFDSNTEFMGDDTVNAIKRYVENGGTFIALHETGRHGLLEPDSWPISALTGFKVLATGTKGTITFGNDLPVFKGWEGRKFAGEGSALDWKDNQTAKGVGLGLGPAADGAIALAKWDDGSVAVGMRKLGKGRIIVLGSTFWRYGRDIGGNGIWRTQFTETDFLERLFTDLGVERTATASTPLVYTRKVITKNGLQAWLIAYNTTPIDRRADVGFAIAQKPAEVDDMADGKPVAFEYANGWVTIKNAAIAGNGVRVFGVTQSTLAGGVGFWWQEKTKFWRSPNVPAYVAKAVADRDNAKTVAFTAWKFLADKDGAIGKSDDWARPEFDDRAWSPNDGRPWHACNDLKDYTGTGLYRSILFSIPRSWNGKAIKIVIAQNPMWVKPDAFYLNGTKIPEFASRKLECDVTDLLKKDGNVLCIKVRPNQNTPQGGGLFFATYLQPILKLDPSNSLLGDWQAVMADWLTHQPTTLPGKITAKYIVRNFNVPASWRGRNVYISISPGLKDAGILINGRYVWTTAFLESEDINLTPFIAFGRQNRIELWPQSSYWLNYTKGDETGVINLNSITVGCETK